MERLTFEGNFCDISMCQENPCPYNDSCTQREVWERLKAYEKTGLEPEQIQAAVTEEAILKLAAQCLKTTPDRLRELAQADGEGRMRVLPCKIGDEVWGIRNYRGVKHPQRGRVNDMFFTKDMRLMIVVKHICYGIWGVNVFLTREEAEAALLKEKENNHEY